MVPIPSGTFTMGSTEGKEDEQPMHFVRIAQPFHMAATETTQGQWEAVMGTRPWAGQKFVKSGSNYPAVYVSWDDAQKFCRRLSQKEGKTYRLPYEAEWEYAARAGSEGKWSFGSNEGSLGTYAWFDKNTLDIGEEYAHLVGTKQANAFGLYDLHGNVWEWCEDFYHNTYHGSPNDGSAWVTGGEQVKRVRRGGGFTHNADDLRSAIRSRGTPGDQVYILGFRVVCTTGTASSTPTALEPTTPAQMAPAKSINADTSPTPVNVPKRMSRDEFKQAVMGKTQQEVMRIIGKPATTLTVATMEGECEVWMYNRITVHPVTEQVDMTANVRFLVSSNRVILVDF